MSESLAYLDLFNTNPVCFGVGPTDVPKDPDRLVALVIYIIAAAFIIVTSMWYMYVRQFRRRLRIRSLNPIVMGSIGSAIIIITRAVYNYAGREYLSCAGNLTLVYAFFFLNLVSDNLLVASFMVKQKLRQQISVKAFGGGAQKHSNTEAEKRLAHATSQRIASGSIGSGGLVTDDSSTQLHTGGWATPQRWFKGFWNHFILLSEVTQFTTSTEIDFHSKLHFKQDPFISPLRELTYDILSTMLFSGALYFGLGLRLGLVPALDPQNGCSGCTMFWQDIPVLLACLCFVGLLQLLMLRRTRDVKDPLGYRGDLRISTLITTIVWIGYFLAVFDPSGLMKQQKVDWFLFESFAAFLLHCHRCLFQLYRVSRMHKLGEQKIRLIDLLQDKKAEIKFEKYLMGELASENLLFWREGIKYKLQFDRMRDFDYSQQFAKMLFRTFVSRHAQLPVNISGVLRDNIETKFKSGFVGKNVFDEALIEVYNMMQNGPFYRFVRSQEFVDYAKNNADFSLLTSIPSSSTSSSLSVVPLSENVGSDLESMRSDTGGPAISSVDGFFNVADYIHRI